MLERTTAQVVPRERAQAPHERAQAQRERARRGGRAFARTRAAREGGAARACGDSSVSLSSFVRTTRLRFALLRSSSLSSVKTRSLSFLVMGRHATRKRGARMHETATLRLVRSGHARHTLDRARTPWTRPPPFFFCSFVLPWRVTRSSAPTGRGRRGGRPVHNCNCSCNCNVM